MGYSFQVLETDLLVLHEDPLLCLLGREVQVLGPLLPLLLMELGQQYLETEQFIDIHGDVALGAVDKKWGSTIEPPVEEALS